jgi:hypothetical protein
MLDPIVFEMCLARLKRLPHGGFKDADSVLVGVEQYRGVVHILKGFHAKLGHAEFLRR